MTQFIPYGHHEIDDADIQSVVEILRSEWLTTGPVIEVFEEALSRRAGGTPVVSVSSGTAALHAAYAAAGIGPGDEVITPPITFVATQAAAIACGATIVFADVLADPDEEHHHSRRWCGGDSGRCASDESADICATGAGT